MSSRSVILLILHTFLLNDFTTGFDWNLDEERSYPTTVRDSPQLLHLLESLSVQKHSPDTSNDIYVEYDYIVVGAGAAGSVVASRLSEVPCVSVLLLEAGPPPPRLTDIVAFSVSFLSTNLDWKHETIPQRYTGRGQVNKIIKLPNGKCLGGSTSINAGIHVRGNKKDYDGWAKMGAEGWSYEEVLPYFIKLEDNRDFEYIRNGYHGVGGPVTVEKPRYISEIKQPIFEAIKAMGYQIVDPNSRHQTGFYDLQSNMRYGQRCSTAKAYLVPAENRTNLDILPNAFVRKVVIVNGQAVGVLFDYNGLTYKVNTRREVILSAGAIKTPQILMLSGIGPEEHLRQFNIPVHANLPVGKNFQDHVEMYIQAVLKPYIQEFGDKLGDEAYIKEYILNRSGPLASVAGQSYVAFLHNDEINPETDFPNYELYIGESSARAPLMYWNLKPEVFQQVYGPYQNDSIIACFSQLLHPYSRGRIQLRSANPYDQPIIDPNYLADPRDVDDIVAGLKTCKRLYDRPEMRQVILEPFQTLYPGCEEFSNDEDAYFRCMLRTVLFTIMHYCCTAKMGDVEDPTTVLDPQLRYIWGTLKPRDTSRFMHCLLLAEHEAIVKKNEVKYIKGLRVADASVMPKITNGNTGVPAIMIGEKAADMIKETIECEYAKFEDGYYYRYLQQNVAKIKLHPGDKIFGGYKLFEERKTFTERK